MKPQPGSESEDVEMFIPFDPNAQHRTIISWGPPDPRYRASWGSGTTTWPLTIHEEECRKAIRALPATDEVVDEETWQEIAAIIERGAPDWVLELIRSRSAMRAEDV